MELQNYEKKVAKIREAFKAKLKVEPELKAKKLKLSWSNWGFGTETLEASARRLRKHGIEWIEPARQPLRAGPGLQGQGDAEDPGR